MTFASQLFKLSLVACLTTPVVFAQPVGFAEKIKALGLMEKAAIIKGIKPSAISKGIFSEDYPLIISNPVRHLLTVPVGFPEASYNTLITNPCKTFVDTSVSLHQEALKIASVQPQLREIFNLQEQYNSNLKQVDSILATVAELKTKTLKWPYSVEFNERKIDSLKTENTNIKAKVDAKVKSLAAKGIVLFQRLERGLINVAEMNLIYLDGASYSADTTVVFRTDLRRILESPLQPFRLTRSEDSKVLIERVEKKQGILETGVYMNLQTVYNASSILCEEELSRDTLIVLIEKLSTIPNYAKAGQAFPKHLVTW